MMTIFLILALVIAIFVVIFALQNTAITTVTFFAWEFEQSLALVIIFTVLIGVLIGIFTLLPGTIRRSWRLTSQKKKLDAGEKKLAEEKTKREELERQIQVLRNPEPAAPDEMQRTPDSSLPPVSISPVEKTD